MRLSKTGSNFLKSIESLRLLPYDDQSGRLINEWCKGATIGYGHLLTPQEWPWTMGGINCDMAERLFDFDIEPFERAVSDTIKAELKSHQFDALVILAFNIGIYNFKSSSVVKILIGASSSYPTLESAWKAWNRSQGKINQGLINRRAAEWKLFKTGEYERW